MSACLQLIFYPQKTMGHLQVIAEVLKCVIHKATLEKITWPGWCCHGNQEAVIRKVVIG
jgi:hypothetical protein